MTQPKTRDVRVLGFEPIAPPEQLLSQLAVSSEVAELVLRSRATVRDIIQGDDARLLVIVGPCSIHDPKAALDYAQRLKALSDELSDRLLIVMRVYFEKPRTTVGWKGFINDPALDGSCDVNRGLREARQLLLEINALGLPALLNFSTPSCLNTPPI